MKRIILFCIQGLLATTFLLQGSSLGAILPNYHNKLDTIAVKYSSNKLDSIVSYGVGGTFVRKIDSYEFRNNRLTSCVETSGDVITKYDYDYDDCGNQVLYNIWRFNKDQNTYSLKFKEEKVYRNNIDCKNPLLISYVSEGIPESEATIYMNEKNTYEYFPNGNIWKFIKEDGAGTVIREMTYTYDANGKTETVLSKNLENFQLIPTAKIEYTYFPSSENINHFKTETIYRYSNNAEVVCMKTTYDPGKYSTDKLFISTVEHYDTLGVSINKEVRTSKYSEDFVNMLDSKVEIYDKNNNLATTIQYDDKGNVVQILKAASDASSTQNSIWKGEWNYNEQAGVDTYYLKNSETSVPLWYISVYYNNDVTTNVISPADLENSGFIIFPNPVKDDLFIECLSNNQTTTNPVVYSIYNLTGKLQLHGIISSGKEAIPVQTLSTGSYIISFVAGNYKGTSIFVKN